MFRPILVDRGRVRAFSVKQPWAGLLLSGQKRYEVRRWWPTEVPGLALVHASSGSAPWLSWCEGNPDYEKALARASMAEKRTWTRSAIIGVIEIRCVWRPGRHPRLSQRDRVLCGRTTGQALWEIGRRWRFRLPISCDGRLHFWDVPAAKRKRVSNELRRLKQQVQRSKEQPPCCDR
jgi:hypothetical protein